MSDFTAGNPAHQVPVTACRRSACILIKSQKHGAAKCGLVCLLQKSKKEKGIFISFFFFNLLLDQIQVYSDLKY